MFDFSEVKNYDPELAEAMENELTRQRTNLELIASENLVSKAVMAAMGSHLTNKYAEGYPGKRYYGGCQYVDVVEDLARERAKELFGCEYVNVQPHSGAQANMAVFFAVLNVGDTYMGMSLDHGGHLTHGSPVNMSGKNYHCVPYGVNDEGFIDYDEVERIALECKPKMIIAGASAYARAIDFKRFREIADKVGAVLMVDMAHIAGLVAAGLHQSPIPYAHVTTTTTHKTLRGPRGGMIMCSNEVNEKYNFNKAIFPGIQGGPLMHVIAGKAVAFKEALDPSFKEYMTQVVKNADTLANALIEEGFDIVSGGTDNHLMLVDLKKYDLTGKEAEKVLDSVHITCNKNTVPNDPKSPFVTSGLRLGTPAVTTRGLKGDDMKVIAKAIRLTLLDKKLDENNNHEKQILELNLQKVYDFATTSPINEIRFILESARTNKYAAEQSFKYDFGHSLGKTLRGKFEHKIMGDSIFSHILSYTSAACDARMAGAMIPIMSNSGSGNQGIAATLPIVIYAEENGKTEEELIRALILSHLTVIYIKQSLGRLSALCGCVVAATGSSCGITYLMGGKYPQITAAVKNMIANLTGMICDGAKPSCALKLTSGVSTAVLSAILAMEQKCVTSVEGIIENDVDQCIRNLTLIGSQGMNETDKIVLDIMTHKH